jgi:hypothetical protein
MSGVADDPMGPFFGPLWADFQKIGGDDLLVAGGYGLFLKQNWLLANLNVPIIIPLAQWRDTTPRVTKDFDLIIGLDLIADAEAQKGVLAVLEKHGFKVTAKNPRWQFEKQLGENRKVVVEIHAPLPSENHDRFEVTRTRIKRKPSLHNDGIHGRTNPEAVGCDLHPFRFEVAGVGVSVTNPVTWCVMKLTAMRDQWKRSEETERDAEDRAFCREQAIKHARDVCRIVAMVTQSERDRASEIIESVKSTPQFSEAAGIFAEFFQPDQGWGVMAVEAAWEPADLQLIRSTLATWFGKSTS